MREWKPGDVAMVTVPKKSLPTFAVHERGDASAPMCRFSTGWALLADPDYYWKDDYAFFSDIRPLVVVDPVDITGPEETDDADPIAEIANCLERLAEAEGANAINGSYRGKIAARLGLRFKAVLSPPRPDEPTGLGAVVEDAHGVLYVRVAQDDRGYPDWKPSHSMDRMTWLNVAAVKVLSDGVQP